VKAAVLEDRGVINNREIAQPAPAPGHVLLAVRAVSICGSDISRYVKGHRLYPLVLGHECSGVVAAVGAGVDPGLVGRHAAVIPLIPCFGCEQCRLGHYSACHNYSFIGSRQAGGFAEYVELPERNCFLLPDHVPFEAAALIEPATVARHILALGSFRAGQTAVVFGAGSIGLMLIQWLRILGASLIICTDIVEENLAVARRLGAHAALDPRQVDVAEEVRKLAGEGVDLALEAAGAPQTLLQTIQVTRPRGVVVCAGNQPPDGTLPLSFIENMMRKELQINGCFMSYSAPFPGAEWTDSLAAVLDGGLDMAAMISHRFPLAEAPAVFARIGDHSLAHRKIIFYPAEQA
jgi:threonine dehydrogenase-like Zn-dependent dehydrogenase